VTILDVENGEHDGVVRVGLRGELDLSTVPKVEEALRLAEAGSPPLLVIDLSKLGFLDSTGLRCVITAAERAKEQGRRLVVVRGPDPVQRVFSITGVDERIELVDDLAGLT
jgi:anti-sigma B factor antagonist